MEKRVPGKLSWPTNRPARYCGAREEEELVITGPETLGAKGHVPCARSALIRACSAADGARFVRQRACRIGANGIGRDFTTRHRQRPDGLAEAPVHLHARDGTRAGCDQINGRGPSTSLVPVAVMDEDSARRTRDQFRGSSQLAPLPLPPPRRAFRPPSPHCTDRTKRRSRCVRGRTTFDDWERKAGQGHDRAAETSNVFGPPESGGDGHRCSCTSLGKDRGPASRI